MDPVSVLVWAVLAALVLVGLVVALRLFKGLVMVVLALAALGFVIGLVTEPTVTLQKVNGVVTQVTHLIEQLKTSLGR